MAARPDPYACCGEGRLRPAWTGGDTPTPILGCTACGQYIEPDPNHPDAASDPTWHTAALAVCPPMTGDPEEDLGESDLYNPDYEPW